MTAAAAAAENSLTKESGKKGKWTKTKEKDECRHSTDSKINLNRFEYPIR